MHSYQKKNYKRYNVEKKYTLEEPEQIDYTDKEMQGYGRWYVGVEEDCDMYLRPSMEILDSTGYGEGKNVGYWNTYEEALRAKQMYEKMVRINKHDDKMDSLKYVNIETKRGNGGKTSYYKLPENAKELGDLIYHKEMNHSIGEAFCALYRLKDNGEYTRNLRKAKYYIDLELSRMDGQLV